MAETDFAHYYQTELAYYRALMREMADAFPEVAHLVSDRGADAAAERLLQGAALLTGRLRQRIDDDIPEIVHALFDASWPQFIRPLPALTLLRFVGDRGLRSSHTVAEGAVVKTRPDNGVACTFTTCTGVELDPLEIAAVEFGRASPSDLQLRVRLKTTGTALSRLGRLRFHFLGDEATRHALYLWLVHHAASVTVRDETGRTLATLRQVVRPVGFADDEALGPCASLPLPGLRLLHEYFAFVGKFLAADVDLQQTQVDRALREIELVFHLGQPPRADLAVDASNLSLGCVPAMNVTEPVQVSLPVRDQCSEYHLRPPRGEVFDILRVSGYEPHSGRWLEYPPFFGQRLVGPRRNACCCYQVRHREDSVEGVQTYLLITDAAGTPRPPAAEVMQVELRHTDGDLPLRLRPGAVDQPTDSAPSFATFADVTPIVPPQPKRVGGNRHWRLLAQLAIHPDDLCSVNGLAQVLAQARGERATTLPKIEDVRTELSARLVRQTMVPLRRIRVDLADASVPGEGQLYLLGQVLRRLFAPGFDSQVQAELTVRAMPSGRQYRYDPL